MAPIVDAGSVKPYRSPKQRRQWIIALVVVGLTACIAAAAYSMMTPREKTYTLADYETAVVKSADLVQTTQASGTVALPLQISIASPEEGYASGLYVTEGDTVAKGQVLARLKVTSLEEDLEDDRTALKDAVDSYEKAVAQNGIYIARARREIDTLDVAVAAETRERDRLARLVEISASKKSELETAQETLDTSLRSKKEKDMQLEENRTLYALEERALMATVENDKTRIARLEERIRAATIASPMDGQILSVTDELAVSGSLIEDGTSLFTIADPTSAIVELEVLEQYSSLLSVGQSVKLTVGSVSFTGHITNIGKVATQSSDGLGATVVVKVKPDARNDKLLLGNTAVGELVLGTRKGILQLARGPYLTTGNQKCLYKVEGNTARKTSVTFGATEGNIVEILEGVKAGDTVVVSGYQNFIDFGSIRLQAGGGK
jgi:HlyD family secretion protein